MSAGIRPGQADGDDKKGATKSGQEGVTPPVSPDARRPPGIGGKECRIRERRESSGSEDTNSTIKSAATLHEKEAYEDDEDDNGEKAEATDEDHASASPYVSPGGCREGSNGGHAEANSSDFDSSRNGSAAPKERVYNELIRYWQGPLRWTPSVAVGLANLGNTCYLNSVLQALLHSPSLVAYFSHSWPSIAPPEYSIVESKRNRNELTNAFAHLMKSVWEKGVRRSSGLNRTYHNPSPVVRGVIRAVPEFSENGQQDAQEALNYLLNCLHDELSVAQPPEFHPARGVLLQLDHEQRDWERRAQAKKRRAKESMSSSPSHGTSVENSQKGGHLENGSVESEAPLTRERRRSRLKKKFRIRRKGASDGSKGTKDTAETEEDDIDIDSQGEDDSGAEAAGAAKHAPESAKNQKDAVFWQLKAPYMQSVISDTFHTLLVQRVSCLECGFTSLSLEEHFELALALPSKTQVRELRRSSYVDSYTGLGDDAYGGASPRERSQSQSSASSRHGGMWGALKNLKTFVGLDSPILSLRECLEAFFSPEQLLGEEQYHCEKCKSKQDAEKSHSFAHVPEVICFNFKRFNRNMGAWALSSYKNLTAVTYPLRDLDLTDFMFHSTRSKGSDCATASGPAEAPSFADPSDGSRENSYVYDLYAVVRHSGSINGGHYIAMCLNHVNNKWYSYDDDICTEVPESDVQTSDAYLLFYRKRKNRAHSEKYQKVRKALEKQAELVDEERQRWVAAELERRRARKQRDGCQELANESADFILDPPPDEELLASLPDFNYYISTAWSLKWGTLVEPGAMTAFDVVCDHGSIVPLPRNDVHARMMRVSCLVYQAVRSTYGAGPALSVAEFCTQCQTAQDQLQARRSEERSSVHKANTRPDPKVFAMSSRWVRLWSNFVENSGHLMGRGTWRGTQPCGPVDNKPLLQNGGPNLKPKLERGRDFIMVNELVWAFFMKVYGGGPSVQLLDGRLTVVAHQEVAA